MPMNRRRQIRFTSQGTTSLKGRRRYRDRRTHCRLRHLSVPYTGMPQQSLREIVEAVYTSQDRFSHLHSFEAEGVAEVEFEADVRGGLRRFFYAWSGDAPAEAWPSDKRAGDPVLLRVPDPDPLPAWLTDADIDYYVSEFEQSGFRGPLQPLPQ